MSKKFHARETALLLAPVLAIGAIGLWMSKRSIPKVDDGQLHPHFHIDKLTALEAFRGANAAFVIEFKGDAVKNFDLQQMSSYLQVKTPRGVEVARGDVSGNVPWDKNLWNYASGTNSSRRELIRTDAIPAGELHFGFFGIAQPNPPSAASPASTLPPKPLRLSGKWKVDRAQFQPTGIAAWPRKPLVKVRKVVITRKTAGNARGGVPNDITVEVVFDLQNAAMNKETTFETNFSQHHFTPPGQMSYGISYGTGQTIRETPRTRVRFVTVSSKAPTTKMNVTGRVSADNRWPLGFQIEPFVFKNAKVGQKLKFKQFPVALPKF